jgi:hypothetical protein
MKISIRSIASSLAVLALPVAAVAQSPSPADVAYCQAMADLIQRYVIGTSGSGSFGTVDLNIKEAMVTCGSTPTASIPILEQALHDNKIDLPPR